jgi:hypothetical protein
MSFKNMYYHFDDQKTILDKLNNNLQCLKMKLFMEEYDNKYYHSDIKEEIDALINEINQKEKEFNIYLISNSQYKFQIKKYHNCYDICQEYLYIILNLMKETFNSNSDNIDDYIILCNKIKHIYQYILNHLFTDKYREEYSLFNEVIFMDEKLNTSLSEFDFNDTKNANSNVKNNMSIKKVLNNALYEMYKNIDLNNSCFMSYLSNVYESSCDENALSSQINYILTDTVNQLKFNISKISSIIN